ncbi:helix-turn-helix transcriptional regulator [Streptomyces sp. NPDC048255]|uniref:helix-turn-helix transcriptional regulator n=1 Tax=Streptomyces sp. NPDC048255 TaxID=3154713 RepID=UPI0033EEA48F
MTTNPLALWGIDDTALSAYEATLAGPDRCPADIAAELGLPVERTAAALARLTSLGLVHSEDGRLRAGRPSTAVARLVRDRLHAAAADAARAAELLGAMDRFTDLYASATDPPGPLVTVRDLSEHWQRASATAAAHACVESLSVNPDAGTFEMLTPDYLPRFAELLREGTVTLRCIVTVDQLHAPVPQAAIGALTEAGAEFRASVALPSWFHILGPHYAGVPLVWGHDPSADGMAHHLVQAPALVAALRALFEELWCKATPVPCAPGATRDPRGVLRLLAQGLTDEAVARRLGVSVRTVRQRVSEAMDELGVRTRFAAAAAAARNGWFDQDFSATGRRTGEGPSRGRS